MNGKQMVAAPEEEVVGGLGSVAFHADVSAVCPNRLISS